MDKTIAYYPIAFVTFALVALILQSVLPEGNLYVLAGFLIALLIGHVIGEKTMRSFY